MILKSFTSILVRRAKTQFIDYVIDILISSLQEWKRKNQQGAFDTDVEQTKVNSYSNQNNTNYKQEINAFFNPQNK